MDNFQNFNYVIKNNTLRVTRWSLFQEETTEMSTIELVIY